jgi:Apea-like HEPN
MAIAVNLNAIVAPAVSRKRGEQRGRYAPTVDAEPSAASFARLKEKQRRIREAFPEHVGLRIHRALSWLGRAEAEATDPDVRFILLWIGFNSAYAAELPDALASERGAFNAYFELLVGLDREHRIYSSVWKRFSQEIRLLLDNPYIFGPFWNHQNGLEGYADWDSRLASSRKVIARAMAERETLKILSILFDRLYVLRNQLVHGGATWNSGVNRNQVRDGAKVLGWLLPVMIDIMMDNPDRDWGKPFYPVVS